MNTVDYCLDIKHVSKLDCGGTVMVEYTKGASFIILLDSDYPDLAIWLSKATLQNIVKFALTVGILDRKDF